MLLQQFLPAICQISSEFFIFQQDSALASRTLEAINFISITLPNVEWFQKFFQNRLSSKFVIEQWSTAPPHLNHGAIHSCDVLSIIIHVSGCHCFSGINISQDSNMFELWWDVYYHFARNLLLSLLVKEFWKWLAFGKARGQNNSDTFFWTRCTYTFGRKITLHNK